MTILLIILGVFTRLIPHWPNFTAIGGLSLFAGAALPRRTSWTVPLGSMLISDYLLTATRHQPFWHGQLLAVYLSFGFIWLLGTTIRRQANFLLIGGASLGASSLFFLLTNSVWLTVGHGLYQHTLAGQLASYVAALPFFGPTVLSDLATTLSLFVLARLTLNKPKLASARPAWPATASSNRPDSVHLNAAGK